MTYRWLRKLILAAALAVMPLQGFAAGIADMLPCHGNAAPSHTSHDGGRQGRTPDLHRHQDDSGTHSDIKHSCCHSSAAPSSTVALPAALGDSPVRTLAADTLNDLFVPEQPQRPPLA